MDNETIIKLVNAGYTKEEIAKMDAESKPAGEESKPAGTSAGKELPKGNEGTGEKQGAPTPEHESEIDKTIKALTDTVAGLTETVKAMQSAAVKGAVTDKPSGTDALKDTIDSFIKTL